MLAVFKDSLFNTDCNNLVNKIQDISSNRGIVTSIVGDTLVLLQINLTLTSKLVITRI